MTTDPERIRRDIERTRHELGADVEALGERFHPGQAVQRRVDRLRDSAADVKDRILGTAAEAVDSTRRTVGSAASDVADSASVAASSAASQAADTAASVDDAVRSIPQDVRARARGNPLAVGLIAFGAGWLISSLLPPHRREEKVAHDAAGLARQGGEQLAARLDQVRSEVEDDLRGPAQDAAAAVRSTAEEAVSRVAEEGRAAAGHLTDEAAEARHRVRDPAAGPAG